jgi:hypothetical protein
MEKKIAVRGESPKSDSIISAVALVLFLVFSRCFRKRACLKTEKA